jgi:DNA-binding transcriptional LysR family regulator
LSRRATYSICSTKIAVGNAMFAEVLAGHQARYPEVRLEVDLGERLVNLVDRSA